MKTPDNPEEERSKLKKFIEDNPELLHHVKHSSQTRLMYEIMKREEKLTQNKT